MQYMFSHKYKLIPLNEILPRVLKICSFRIISDACKQKCQCLKSTELSYTYSSTIVYVLHRGGAITATDHRLQYRGRVYHLLP
jgi:hypothetical protein